MSYPRNSASPPVIAVGTLYLLADGTIQTTGASARVKTGSGAWGAAAGTLACDSTSGVWTYTPTQAETDAESFLVAVYKSASTSAQVTVATSASATAGYSGVDWGDCWHSGGGGSMALPQQRPSRIYFRIVAKSSEAECYELPEERSKPANNCSGCDLSVG